MIRITAWKFGVRLAETLKKQVPQQANNSDTVDGLTGDQIASGTTKSHVGLGNLQNYPLKTIWTAGETPSTADYASPGVITAMVADVYKFLFGKASDGTSVFIRTGHAKLPAQAEPTIDESVGPVVGNAELESCKTAAQQTYLYETIGKVLYVKSGATYVVASADALATQVLGGKWYYNKTTKSLFYAENPSSFIRF